MLEVVGFSRLPPALAAVTSLTELRLGSTQPSFRLGKRGLEALLHLPALATLTLPPLSDHDERRLEQLQQARPRLRVSRGRPRWHRSPF